MAPGVPMSLGLPGWGYHNSGGAGVGRGGGAYGPGGPTEPSTPRKGGPMEGGVPAPGVPVSPGRPGEGGEGCVPGTWPRPAAAPCGGGAAGGVRRGRGRWWWSRGGSRRRARTARGRGRGAGGPARPAPAARTPAPWQRRRDPGPPPVTWGRAGSAPPPRLRRLPLVSERAGGPARIGAARRRTAVGRCGNAAAAIGGCREGGSLAPTRWTGQRRVVIGQGDAGGTLIGG